jgi:ketosteroid isomerase-like protein
MSAEANVETVKLMYDAFTKGDVATILDQCTDDVDWASDASGDTAPWWGEHKGKEALTGFFTGIAGTSEVTEFTPLSFATNETEVMVFLRYGSRNTATGKEASMHLHHYWRFRDGKVEYYRGSEDTQLTAATFEP